MDIKDAKVGMTVMGQGMNSNTKYVITKINIEENTIDVDHTEDKQVMKGGKMVDSVFSYPRTDVSNFDLPSSSN